jgi:hypothetical protein
VSRARPRRTPAPPHRPSLQLNDNNSVYARYNIDNGNSATPLGSLQYATNECLQTGGLERWHVSAFRPLALALIEPAVSGIRKLIPRFYQHGFKVPLSVDQIPWQHVSGGPRASLYILPIYSAATIREQPGEETIQNDPKRSQIAVALTAFVSIGPTDSRPLSTIASARKRPASAFDPVSGHHYSK